MANKMTDMIANRVGAQPHPFNMSTAPTVPELPTQAGALPERLQDIARSYLGARRQSGVSLLEAARWLSEARLEAQHGEWKIFLEAIGLDESRARAQIRIHEEAQRDPLFADRIINGFLSETVARELLPLPTERREELLARETPITREDVREAKRVPAPVLETAASMNLIDLGDILLRLDAHGYAKTTTRQKGMTTFYSFRDYRSTLEDGQAGEIEQAEGELPLWLAELDSHAAYAQAKQERYHAAKERAERLGYDLTRDGLYFVLAIPGQGMPATRGTLDQLEKTIAGYERNAAKQAAAPADSSDDSVMIAAIRRQAEELGMQVVWEDDQVILYWHVEDIDGLAPMSYAAALDWLKAAWMERETGAASDSAAHRAKEIRDAGRIERARSLIGNGEHDAARVVLDQIEVSTWDRDKLLATIPAGRQITLVLTLDECAALLKEARMFSSTELTKRLPTIGQALILMVEAIKG